MRVFSILLSVVLAASAYGQDNSLLSKYRTMALEHEQNVQASKSQLEATELRAKSAKSDYFPKLDVNGNYNQIGRTVAVEGQPGYNNFYAVNAVLSQPIYQGGVIRNTYKASQIQTGIAADNVNFVSQNLVLGLDQFYYNAVSRREVAYITEVYKQNIDTLVGVISNRVDQEVVSSNDLYMAQVKLNDAEFQLMQAQKEQRISLMELNRQIGVPVNDATDVEDSLAADMIVLNMDEQLQTAMTSRPEVSAQEKNVSLSEQNKKIVTGKYNPQLSVNVGGFYGTDFPYLTDKSVGDYTLQANVKIPIFYWGKRRYEGNASDLNIQQANLQLDRTKEIVELQVNRAYFDLVQSQQQVDLTRNSLEKANKNLQIVSERYSEGLVDIINVLDANMYWQEAYLNYVQAKYDFNMSKSVYLWSTGQLASN